jgi:hypothetical protein
VPADADAGNITIDKVVVNGGKPVVAGPTKAQRSKHGVSTHPPRGSAPACTRVRPAERKDRPVLCPPGRTALVTRRAQQNADRKAAGDLRQDRHGLIFTTKYGTRSSRGT